MARSLYTPLDKAVYRLTGGRRGISPSKTVLYLTTTGRKSGLPRRVPILFLREDDRYWVMASNYGQAHHPAWSTNLLANPSAVVQEGGRTLNVIARLATDEEKQELWPRLLNLYPAWKSYSEWTDRNFRLFCLTPRA
jgi:deazaflavin-dependent oxidoreductase (nitroreductase family)